MLLVGMGRGIRTKEALNVGIPCTSPKEVLWIEVTVMAPGGKLVTNCDIHITAASEHRMGVARKAECLNWTSGFDLRLNSSSIVETFKVEERRICHKCWAKAIPNEARRMNPKAFARIFEAVVTYD